ncbi:MAG: diaminobutyrate--2-oxoglutarate transaminase [Pseudomonadota bacterium]
MKTDVFSKFESNVRSYCRSFPVTFATAQGAHMIDTGGRRYIDLLSGAGTLNYGHNNPAIVGPVVDYLSAGGIVHSLDMHTQAKADFIECFQSVILEPRGLHYKLQFPGPTGTNAIEAAVKLARKVTKRSNVVTFTNAFHGMTLGSLALTANPGKRSGAGAALHGSTFMPYDGYLGTSIDTIDVIEPMLRRPGSGVDKPAAIVLELVQGEGGLNVAGAPWCQRLAALAREIGALLIVDDIQAGNGRTGTYFSFESCKIVPDIVTLSKSLSGFGTPFSLVLLKPELDQWAPGEHNGTFRGNNLAFVGATAAIRTYWRDQALAACVAQKADFVRRRFDDIAAALPPGTVQPKGRGLFQGLAFKQKDAAGTIASRLFEYGLIIETCGHGDQVLKLLPPLTIEQADLATALDHIEREVMDCCATPVLETAV